MRPLVKRVLTMTCGVLLALGAGGRVAQTGKPAAPPAPAAAPANLPPPQPGARLSPGAPMPPAELEAFVDGVVRQAMAQDHIAGVEVSVVQAGQVVLKQGLRLRRSRPASRSAQDTLR